MANVQTAPVAVSAPPGRRPFFLLGILLFLLGPAIYAVQFNLKQFVMPWYLPILATVGVALMAVGALQRRGIARPVGLVLFALLCGFTWYFLVIGSKTPEYKGPAQVAQKVPAFTTTRADGTPFTDKDLQKGNFTVLVFNRGRW